jgi:hypothetical protein
MSLILTIIGLGALIFMIWVVAGRTEVDEYCDEED